jgi:hypothetical protein
MIPCYRSDISKVAELKDSFQRSGVVRDAGRPLSRHARRGGVAHGHTGGLMIGVAPMRKGSLNCVPGRWARDVDTAPGTAGGVTTVGAKPVSCLYVEMQKVTTSSKR